MIINRGSGGKGRVALAGWGEGWYRGEMVVTYLQCRYVGAKLIPWGEIGAWS